jgi:uncharacterized membrane protein
MKKTSIIIWQFLVGLAPIIYLVSIWSKLPGSVPLHYNSDFEADRFGSKAELAGLLIFLTGVSIGVSLLMLNLDRFDPKKRYNFSGSLMNKISWSCILFFTAIGCYIVYETEQYFSGKQEHLSPKFIVAMVCLLFVVLGNFMNNIKPNYFVGIRTPWSLEDADNWRKTHHFGSKLWFFGGLVMLLLVLLLPEKCLHIVVLSSIVPLVIVPLWYSYHLFRQKSKNGQA